MTDTHQTKCIGGPLWGLNTQRAVEEFHYTNPSTGKTTKYTKKIMYGHAFFVAKDIDVNFAKQMALLLLNPI
ncbi:hypothetical protein F2A31_05955 [Acinetobacter suaedae]|uniref:Uncharacterized protein n=1 Tax=Acinetobacter suaedae TaxID=2609668 RepID=A0A5P1USE2_9GAMM|nr:hypothetical protein [Acinetobacter sp. C16S1]QER39268.1 hypothetical protein F2A31_05955 [Acinetobacter sp. C16S1]